MDSAEAHLRGLQEELTRLSKAKQSVAFDCYEAMDGHVRRLDASLKKYEVRLRKGAMEVGAGPVDRRKLAQAQQQQQQGQGQHQQKDAELRELIREGRLDMLHEVERAAGEASAAAGKRGRKSAAEVAAAAGVVGAEGSEPVYCTCRKVSYGSMVGCDNEECDIEWFHFACVGLDSKPRGKWLCPNCREGKRKKIKTGRAAAS